jgi:hypothetical protein
VVKFLRVKEGEQSGFSLLHRLRLEWIWGFGYLNF